jgi:hypothetical protein
MPAERSGPAVSDSSGNMGGKGEMIKTPDDLQDLRRKIYAKAKAEAHWRSWGLTSVASAAWRVDGDRSTRPR